MRLPWWKQFNLANLRNMMEDGKRDGELFVEFFDELRAIDSRIRPMGAGGCRRCEKCSYPDEPCVNPELVFPSMEASGLLIIDLCKANNAPYYYGKGTVAYMACCLLSPVD
jgi:predicted metal-binding protein